MARNTSVALGDHFVKFVDEQVESGRYSSASEVVREGLRLLEDREARLAALQAALIEGERGVSTAFDVETFLAAKHAEHQR